jgi:hypothetical protein
MAVAVSLAPAALAQGITFQGHTTATWLSEATAFDHVVNAVANQQLLVAIAIRSSSTGVLSVRYEGALLSRIVAASGGGYCRSELWALTAPPTGVGTVEIALTQANAATAVVASYAGVDPIVPFGNASSDVGNGGTASLTFPSSSSETVVDAICAVASSQPSGMPAAGQTQRWNLSSPNTSLLNAGSDTIGEIGLTISWTLTVGTGGLGWGIAAVALRPAGGANAPDASPPADADPLPDSAAATDAPATNMGDAASGSHDGSVADGAAGSSGPDGAAGVSDAPGSADAVARARDIDLAIGCACRTGRGRPAPVALLLTILLGCGLLPFRRGR